MEEWWSNAFANFPASIKNVMTIKTKEFVKGARMDRDKLKDQTKTPPTSWKHADYKYTDCKCAARK